MALFACTKNVLSEFETRSDETIYINHHKDRQYPPEQVVRKIDKQFEGKKTHKHTLNNKKYFDDVFQQFTLKNGLIVDFLVRDNSPDINIMAIINSGMDQINAKDELLSPLVLKLLKQGTQAYSKSDFQKTAALLGMPIKSWQTSQYSVISINILPQDIELALNLLVQQSAYIKPDKQAFRKIVEQQLLENKLSHSSGSHVAKLFFYQNNYPEDHIYYRHDPDNNEIKNLEKTEILDFYEKVYKPNRTRLIISGDIDVKSLQNKIVRNFSNWNNGLKKQTSEDVQQLSLSKAIINTANNKRPQFDFIERKGARQIDLLYGMVTVPRSSSDWLSLNVIAKLLGGGPSSRLFSDLREKQGLAYFISARQLSGPYQSPFFIQTSVAPDKLMQMIAGINNHFDHLCSNEVNQYELAQIKQQLSGEILFKLQTNQLLVNNKLYQLENQLSSDYLYQLAKDISQIDARQLRIAARKYLCGQHNIIAVGELNSVDKSLREKLPAYHFRTHNLPLH